MSDEFDSLICEVRIEHVWGQISLHLPNTSGDVDSAYPSEEHEKQLMNILREYLDMEFVPDSGFYEVSLKGSDETEEGANPVE